MKPSPVRRASTARRCCRLVIALSVVGALAGCSEQDPKALAKAAEERARASMKSIDQDALAQKVDADTVKQIQTQLTKIDEYMGPINGKLDAVTLNAVEAFQRGQGLRPDGMLTKKTLDLLAETAAKKG